jgi:hypothetical protein
MIFKAFWCRFCNSNSQEGYDFSISEFEILNIDLHYIWNWQETWNTGFNRAHYLDLASEFKYNYLSIWVQNSPKGVFFMGECTEGKYLVILDQNTLELNNFYLDQILSITIKQKCPKIEKY